MPHENVCNNDSKPRAVTIEPGALGSAQRDGGSDLRPVPDCQSSLEIGNLGWRAVRPSFDVCGALSCPNACDRAACRASRIARERPCRIAHPMRNPSRPLLPSVTCERAALASHPFDCRSARSLGTLRHPSSYGSPSLAVGHFCHLPAINRSHEPRACVRLTRASPRSGRAGSPLGFGERSGKPVPSRIPFRDSATVGSTRLEDLSSPQIPAAG